jgi:curved DNA-binding protein CbpA
MHVHTLALLTLTLTATVYTTPNCNQVKIAYRRAMLVVHPDKCADVTPEQKFVAKRVFEAVNEAWATFAAAEMP